MQVVESLEAAQTASQPSPLRDHISWCHHLDDHLRICQVPKCKGANFRDWPGVTTWPNRKPSLRLDFTSFETMSAMYSHIGPIWVFFPGLSVVTNGNRDKQVDWLTDWTY